MRGTGKISLLEAQESANRANFAQSTAVALCLPGIFGSLKPVLLFVPPTGSTIPHAQCFFSQALPSLVLHGLSKERVVAIPLPRTIERIQKQIGLFHRLEHSLTFLARCHRITERSAEAAKHA